MARSHRVPLNDEVYEFGRSHDSPFSTVDGVVLPKRRFAVRQWVGPGRDDWKELGWVEISLTPLKDPPRGHARVAVQIITPVNLAAVP